MNKHDKYLGVTRPSLDDYKQIVVNHMMDDMNNNPESVKPDSLCVVTFVLSKEGDVNVNLNWNEESMQPAKLGIIIGHLMHRITQGDYSNSTMRSLLKSAELQPQNARLLKEIVSEWMKLYDEDENRSIIDPLNVFGVTFAQMIGNRQRDNDREHDELEDDDNESIS